MFIQFSIYLSKWDAPTKIYVTFKWTSEFSYMSHMPTRENGLTAKLSSLFHPYTFTWLLSHSTFLYLI
jgi:hypothetical protein